MKHPERVDDYLEHIAQAISRAIQYAGELQNPQALEENLLLQDAIVRNIGVIGEAANRIQKIAPEFVASHLEIPWVAMRGMRNRLIHDYFDIDWLTVWNTVKHDLPALLEQIGQARKSAPGAGGE